MIAVFFDRESLKNYKAQQALVGVRSALAKRKHECELFHDPEDVPTAEKDGQPIIVFCHSESRSRRILSDFLKKQYRPIFIINRFEGAEYAVSCVSIDYRHACYRMTRRMLEGDGGHVAFLGFNNDSIPDKQRLEGFEAAVREYNADGRVFANFGNVCSCLEEYWVHRDIYKNVVCVNDVHAVALVNRLRESGADCGEYRICGFGNTMLSRCSTPRITTVETNYELAGRCAVELYSVLERNRNARAVTFTVDAEIYEGDSMPGTKRDEDAVPPPPIPPSHGDFYDDGYVVELDRLDGMLSGCDETDLGILRGLLNGLIYEDICEAHFIALNTLKYRVKKLVVAAGVSSKAELVERIRKYRLDL